VTGVIWVLRYSRLRLRHLPPEKILRFVLQTVPLCCDWSRTCWPAAFSRGVSRPGGASGLEGESLPLEAASEYQTIQRLAIVLRMRGVGLCTTLCTTRRIATRGNALLQEGRGHRTHGRFAAGDSPKTPETLPNRHRLTAERPGEVPIWPGSTRPGRGAPKNSAAAYPKTNGLRTGSPILTLNSRNSLIRLTSALA